MAKTQEVAKATKVDLAVVASDSKDASGFGNLDMSRDIAIPYINILQSNSPQLNPSKAEHVEGAKVGQFYNTVSQEVSDSLNVIPVLYQLKYVEWKPREQGGGFVTSHTADSGILSQTKRDQVTFKDVLPNGNYIATTAYHYVMVQGGDDNWSQAVISMTSTQLKKSRRWNSLMLTQKVKGPSGSFTPPTYAMIYKLTTVSESNDRGSWFGYQGRSLDPNDKMRYITIMFDEDRSKIYGLDRIDESESVYIVEGPFDSTFIQNSVAMAGSDVDPRTFGWSDYIWVYENEPRNRQIVDRISKTIGRGEKVVIWPNDISEKDINDMILTGHNVQHVIESNTYHGLEANLKFNNWKKV